MCFLFSSYQDMPFSLILHGCRFECTFGATGSRVRESTCEGATVKCRLSLCHVTHFPNLNKTRRRNSGNWWKILRLGQVRFCLCVSGTTAHCSHVAFGEGATRSLTVYLCAATNQLRYRHVGCDSHYSTHDALRIRTKPFPF